MKTIQLILAFAALLLLASCEKQSITGSGGLSTEQRAVMPFTAVQTSGDIKLNIHYGSTLSIEVKGYSNLVQITETKIQNNKLYVQFQDKYNSVRNNNVEVSIVLPVLESVNSYGSGDVWISDFSNGTNLQVSIYGSSDVLISNSHYITGNFESYGSGDIEAQNLSVKTGIASIYGSGNIKLSCTEFLRSKIFGSGYIWYWGNPALDTQINGSGSVIKKG